MKFEKKRAENTLVQTNPGSGDERISSLFQPDVLLAEQYIENFRRKTPLEPEKALLLAVLEDGVRCFQDNIFPRNRKKQMLFEEAEAWLFSDESNEIFSFASICALLGFDPSYIRRGLRQWQERAVGGTRKKQRGCGSVPQRLVA
jgi:hypothetical protein